MVGIEKEVAYKELLAEAESIMVGMYSNLLLSDTVMSADWKEKVVVWLDMRDNL